MAETCQVDKLQDWIKPKAFGKSKPPTKAARLNQRAKAATGLDDQEKAKHILELQSQQIEKEINKIKSMRNGRMAKIFKMREIVAAAKKGKQEAHAVMNKKGEIIYSNEEINKVNLDHCLQTFKKKDTHEEAKQAVDIKELVLVL